MEDKISTRLEQRSKNARPRDAGTRWWQGFTAPTLLFALATTFLTLLGYGVARSNDALFGFTYPLWYDTPVDLMAMSGDAFIGWFDGIEKALSSLSTLQAAALSGVLMSCVALAFMVGHWLRTSPQAAPWRHRAAALHARCAAWLFAPKLKISEQVAHATLTAAAAGVIGGLSALSGLLLLHISDRPGHSFRSELDTQDGSTSTPCSAEVDSYASATWTMLGRRAGVMSSNSRPACS